MKPILEQLLAVERGGVEPNVRVKHAFGGSIFDKWTVSVVGVPVAAAARSTSLVRSCRECAKDYQRALVRLEELETEVLNDLTRESERLGLYAPDGRFRAWIHDPAVTYTITKTGSLHYSSDTTDTIFVVKTPKS